MDEPPPHPRTIGWLGTTALAMGGSNQSLFLIGALIVSQGSAAVPLLILGLLLSWAAAPGWTELILMWPNRVGGIAATCAEAFRPYSPILANLTGVCYWWGWVPTCGLTAILSASAITQWYLPGVPVPLLASLLVLLFAAVNLCGVKWVTRLAIPIATISALLAFLSGLIPLLSGQVNWHQATTFQLISPFHGLFGQLTSAMAGLYLIGFGAPAFEAAACHVGETIDPVRNVPRAMLASALMAAVYFVALPVIWLGVLGPASLAGDLAQTLGPTFAPMLGNAARAAAIWFMICNMFHGTLQPLAGAARTLMQLAEDGLLPRVLARRSRTDAPWVATLLTAGMAIAFLLTGDPTWVIAAANLCYLISISLPNVAVWLLRQDAPGMARPYRAPRGTITLGLVAAGVWGAATLLGFEQFGMPTVLASMALAYSGAALYAWRRWSDRRRDGLPITLRSLHLKLTGAMLLVLGLDGVGYLLAVSSAVKQDVVFITVLEDIFVAVALLTISVGLILPGMIGHAVSEVAHAADRLATGTLADLSRAMRALSIGDLDAAYARTDMLPVVVHSRDELGDMAASFNVMQQEIAATAVALDGARDGLRQARNELTASNLALRTREEHFRALCEHATDLVRVIDAQGTFRYVSPSHQHILGYSPDELQGRAAFDFIHPEDELPMRAAFAALRRTPGTQTVMEFRVQHADGSWRIVHAIASNHLDNPAIEGIVVSARDITERARVEEVVRQAKEEAEQANQAKSAFLSRMSHELRTPLNAILGFAQLLELDSQDARQDESVRHILKAGRHLLGLINEVLEIARIEAGHLDLSLEPVLLSEVVEEAFHLVVPLMRERAIQATAALAAGDTAYVRADRRRLTQVLLNLLANAAKYNRPGGMVTISCAEPLPGRVRISIQDTGPGIPAEQHVRLFTPFDRLGAEQTSVEGTGMGLALSKVLVEAMGGVIGVESAVGLGSTFWVELPRAEAPCVSVEAPEASAVAEAVSPSAMRTILYIEDNLSNIQLIECVLAMRPGVTLLSAMQGRQGLDLARAHSPDLILLDVHLPDMSGDEVLRRLRVDPATRLIPVVVLSADATAQQKERLTVAGAQVYLTKPLDLGQFRHTVDTVLGREAGIP